MLAALVLPRPLVLAALLVVMAGARVAQPSRSDAAGALAADVTTWTITGRGADPVTGQLVRAAARPGEHPSVQANIRVTGARKSLPTASPPTVRRPDLTYSPPASATCPVVSRQNWNVMIGSSDDSLRRGVFATNRGRPVHRWYEFAEAYSAALVREQLTSLAPGSLAVFDPFAGSGTTVLEASRMGFSCYYSEVNPFLSWLTIVKARDALLIATDGTRPQLEALSKRIERGRLPSKTRSDDKYHPLLIADAKREYFPAGVAAGVVLLLNWINKNLDGSACELAKLSVLTSLISSSNMVRRTDLRRRRITDAKPLSLRETILRRIKQILKDTEDISLPHRIHTMSLGSDVRELCTRSVHVDLTITSPPYLNGTNYCRNTKLELLAGNFIQSEADLGQLRSDGIQAGINGVAKTRIRPSDVPSSVRELCERLQKCAYDSRIPKLVEGYFSDMKRALEVIRRLTYEGGRLILDIGDSKFAGVHVPTNLILTEIAEAVGWRLVGSEKLRSRTSYDGSPLIQVCLELKAV